MSSDAARGARVRAIWQSLPSARFTARPNYIWWVVGTVCIGAFMAAVDASIVNVAIPDLAHYYNATASITGWVLISYLLTLATLLTLFGRLADMLGRRPLYTFGFLVFIVGSAACGAAPSLGFLIVARVFQAAGAAMLQANSVAIITATVPATVRGKAIGFQGSAQAVGLSVGPAVGGALIGLFGWRAIFYVNVPVGIIGTLMAAMILPKDKVTQSNTTFDWWGALLFSPALVAVMLAVTIAPHVGWTSPAVLGLFVATIVLLVAFIRRETNFRAPLVDVKLFKLKIFTMGNVTGLLSYLVMFGVLFLMPFFFERVGGFPSAIVGLLLTAVPIGMTVVSPQAGGLADRYGSRLLTTVGMGVSALGAFILSLTVGLNIHLIILILGLILVGMGLGMFTPPNNSSVMGALPITRLGVGGGILNMSRSLGMAFGTAVSSTLMAGFLAAYGGRLTGGPRAPWVPTMRWSIGVLCVLAVVASVLSLLKTTSENRQENGERPEVPMEF
ncbi:DHA2 family efflux MFS transporter permease subunit [Sulfobacillus harzensis]|uniref:DHA2 family efflux MFS transporter permease subunit n=1 Tax=Sulfobacillus harzensis TaxID=2729629 RepID=A0A7Y0L4C0_9FIRM|nr:DHA2 family efflux MFS transporter permease subunit [Sulfobacillus harzensis]NMP21654.1 DHA2 family efflux MFS transporter permease subunit [Sulfobacillus harzensis]